MSLQSDFQTFLSDIEPSKTTVEQISAAHKALRGYLSAHEHYGEHCVRTYLSGSYAKQKTTTTEMSISLSRQITAPMPILPTSSLS